MNNLDEVGKKWKRKGDENWGKNKTLPTSACVGDKIFKTVPANWNGALRVKNFLDCLRKAVCRLLVHTINVQEVSQCRWEKDV